jgi:hypothetical protein
MLWRPDWALSLQRPSVPLSCQALRPALALSASGPACLVTCCLLTHEFECLQALRALRASATCCSAFNWSLKDSTHFPAVAAAAQYERAMHGMQVTGLGACFRQLHNTDACAHAQQYHHNLGKQARQCYATVVLASVTRTALRAFYSVVGELSFIKYASLQVLPATNFA